MKVILSCRTACLVLFLLAGCGGSGNGHADAGTDAGFDGDGDSGPVHPPGYPGSACFADADCLFDGACLSSSDGFPGGYCFVADCQPDSCPEGTTCFEFLGGVTGCIPTCQDSSECRQDEGYICDADDTCWPVQGSVPPGGPCAYASQCQGGADALCILQMGFLDGYCVIGGCAASCPEGSDCREVLGDNAFGCVALCQSDDDCRIGYACLDEPGTVWDHVCQPGCQTGDCPDPLLCVAANDWSGQMCADMTYICSAENTRGDCEPGHVAHHSASKRWARREVIMLVRHAVHAVQLAYPDTTPLAIGDIGLRDGRTPWGHADTTHDDGRNVDIAYCILPEYQRQWGNAVYRQICRDAQFLYDWSCAVTDQDDPGFGTCVAGSENTHIVDIPRTALLLAKLATGNRMRAVGVEAKIREDLVAEFSKLLDGGLITQQEHDTVLVKIQTAEDDPSWAYHLNHMHVSLCYGDCDTRSAGAAEVLTMQD